MSKVLDSIHDGQLFLGKQPFTTSKKITVLSLSGSLSNDGFLLYHLKEDENDGYFVPFETSKKVEVKTHKNMKKILFETKEEDGCFRLYLNQELVYIHSEYKEKLYLNTHYSPILQDGTLYEFDEKYSIDYNKKNNLKLTPLPIQHKEEEVDQETTEGEVQLETTEEEVQLETSVEEVQLETSVEEVQQETSMEEVQLETLMEEVQQETSMEEVQQETSMEEVHQETTEEEVVQQETLVEEVYQETTEEEVVQQETLVEEVQQETSVEEVHQETSVEEVQQETSMEEVVQQETSVEEVVQQETSVEEQKEMYEEEVIEKEIEENKIICDIPSDKERIKEVVDTMNEIEQEKKEIHEMRMKKKDEADTKQFIQIIQDFNQFQLKKEKERSEEEKERIEKKMFEAQQKNNIIQYIEFNHLNRVYKLPCIKAQQSNELNFHNILMNQIPPSNLVIRKNIAIHVPENNQYYLINYLNTKYLFYRMNGMLIVTNIHTKNSKIVKNKEMIKLMNNDYLLTYNSSILVPMEQKKYFDNHYGTTFQTFMPRL